MHLGIKNIINKLINDLKMKDENLEKICEIKLYEQNGKFEDLFYLIMSKSNYTKLDLVKEIKKHFWVKCLDVADFSKCFVKDIKKFPELEFKIPNTEKEWENLIKKIEKQMEEIDNGV